MASIRQNDDPAPPTKQSQGGGIRGNASKVKDSKLYEFKEQLLLLSSLVATVTYVAGMSLPGGSWEQDDPGGHVAGDPILRDTHYRRYLAFYYCNATALAASLVVSLILIVLPKKSPVWTVVLRMVMVLDLLGLMGAYGAGSCRDAFTTIYSVVAFSFLVFGIIGVFLSYLILFRKRRLKPSAFASIDAYGHNLSYLWHNGDDEVHSLSNSNSNSNSNPDNSNFMSISNSNPDSNSNSIVNAVKRVKKQNEVVRSLADVKKQQEKEKINMLMLLATFAVTITYIAGLSPPGGFWSSTQDGHHLSEPVLQARGRYRVFFVSNTTSFVLSLLIIVMLLENKMLFGGRTIVMRLAPPCSLIIVALLGLMGAYAAGSCREAETTVLVLMVPICVCLLLTLVFSWKQLPKMLDSVLKRFKKRVIFGIPSGTCAGTDSLHLQNTHDLVMLLATLVVTITYQAGLDPPGGLWQDDRDGHKMCHSVLRVTHPTRYKVFFYSNSAAFVTSLVAIMMLQSKFLLTRHTLEATLVLDLFGLIIAYGAGSTRDINTSIYIVALAGLVLVYVIVHITIKDHDPEPVGDDAVKDLDDKRKVLLLVAILAATLTYQAGLTPPGGFWLADDQELGRRAGFPILLDNYPRRYNIFFYCNATSFMASVTLTLLLINPKLYRPGIRCYALYVCMLVGMFGLMGAYAAGSSRHLKTSIYVLTLVGVVLAFIASLLAILWLVPYVKSQEGAFFQFIRFGKPLEGIEEQGEAGHSSGNKKRSKKKEKLQYLMLLGILAASMTYQTGLKPPGGLWQDNNDGHSVGNPILRDINKDRYNAFFYSNSASFMASIVVVVMLLPLTMFPDKDTNSPDKDLTLPDKDPMLPEKHTWRLWSMHTAILLDMMGLLVAYAAGSTRKWETSMNVMFLIVPVLAYIGLYVGFSIFYHRKEEETKGATNRQPAVQQQIIVHDLM